VGIFVCWLLNWLFSFFSILDVNALTRLVVVGCFFIISIQFGQIKKVAWEFYLWLKCKTQYSSFIKINFNLLTMLLFILIL